MIVYPILNTTIIHLRTPMYCKQVKRTTMFVGMTPLASPCRLLFPFGAEAPTKGRRGAAERSDRFLHCEGWSSTLKIKVFLAQNSAIPNGVFFCPKNRD